MYRCIYIYMSYSYIYIYICVYKLRYMYYATLPSGLNCTVNIKRLILVFYYRVSDARRRRGDRQVHRASDTARQLHWSENVSSAPLAQVVGQGI